ncbi:MAG: HAD-IA family hydrolase [Candidatus Thalassarchaeaceae archaeon]
MSTLVIFDLDGVLIDSREMHYHALNAALEKIDEKFMIGWEEHLSTYDGLPTTKKLRMLSDNKGLPQDSHNSVWEEKQRATIEMFSNLKPDSELINFFSRIKKEGHSIAIASNSIRNTVKIVLLRLGLLEYIDFYASNEDVKLRKPHPEMYWKCMVACEAIPRKTVIVEDSHVGRKGALDSGANLVAVEDRGDLKVSTIDEILRTLESEDFSSRVPWISEKLNVLIPMAGAGSRFSKAGYTFPKPLIEVRGKPMIQVVIENLNIEANYIFIVQKEHYEKYSLQILLNLIAPDCRIVQVEGVTEGAACTTLLAKEIIDNENPLLIANSDQFIDWESNEALYAFSADGIDGGILTFHSTHPKWSYAKLDDEGFVSEVAEKKPISENATVGIYYWSKGSEYVKYAEEMIADDIRVNNEFYVCPVYNQAIKDGKKIRIKHIQEMWGLGTPEDLNFFISNHSERL